MAMIDEETKQMAFRMPVALVTRLEAHAERLRAQTPGMRFSISDAVRVLLTKGLDQEEKPQPAAAPATLPPPAPPAAPVALERPANDAKRKAPKASAKPSTKHKAAKRKAA